MANPATMIDPVADPPGPPATRGIVLDKAARVYDLLMPVVTLWHDKPMVRRTVGLLAPECGEKILDIGCATGSVTLAVADCLDADQGGRAVGLDAAPRMIHRALRKAGGRACRFDIGVAEKLPYRDGVFDKAVSTFFFHHLDLADKLTALREVHRVLVADGLFILVDVDVPTTAFGRLCARSGEWLFRQPEIGENIDGKLPPLFAEAGFGDVRRLGHDMGYVTTFALRKTPASDGSCGRP